MATTVSAIQSKVNQFFYGDTSTNSVSAADRLAAISMAVQDIISEFGFDQNDFTYTLNYLDGVHVYDITSAVPGFLEPVDLRRAEEDQDIPFTRKNPRELMVEVGTSFGEEAFATEIRDDKMFLIVNHDSKYKSITLHDCDSATSNGTWQVGESSSSNTSDAENLTLDTVEFKQGSGSINFDVDVSDSVNNRATISNQDFAALDLTSYVDLASLVFWAYIPDVTNFSSITAYWGSSTSDYYSATVTTDYTGNAFVAGWNRIKVNWADTSTTGSPDVTAIDYIRLDFNYGAGQGDDTDFRIDDIRMIRPEYLYLIYQSKHLGESNSGTKLFAYTATTDVPFYSGLYDYFDNPVAHRAASLLFSEVGLTKEADKEMGEYMKAIRDIRRKFPKNQLKETQNFKVKSVNFRKRTRLVIR